MKRKLPIILLALSFALVGGCAVGPKYQKPAVLLPQAWRAPTSTASSLGELKWWALFKDPVLQNLIRAALEQNKDLLVAAARVDQARAAAGVARSNQFPQVSLSASALRERLSRVGAFPFPPQFSVNLPLYTIQPQVSYEADFWGRYKQATAAARDQLLATEEARKNVEIAVVSGVAQSYFTLRELDRELAITQQTVASFKDSVRLTQIRFNGGVASELDVRQAETELDSAAAMIPALEQQIALEEDAISILLGHNPQAIPRGLQLTAQPLPPAVPAGLASTLLERRPDVTGAEDQLKAAYAEIGVAKAQFYPDIALTGSGGFESSILSKFISGPAGIWETVASLSAPIFTAGQLRSNLRLSQAQEREALITYQQTIQEAFREVDDSLISYHKTIEQRAAEESLVTASQKALDLANVRYSNGVATYLDVLDSERTFLSSELSLAQTQGNTLVAVVELYKALGGGWQ
ncbi:MAG TPA: efflux transporter outer membrane subunit [Terriglobia bacterium]|nr:efflux transporter outer membrane subunit [Terriglobia bacterium]